MEKIEYRAELLRDRRYVVKPLEAGCGTHGFYPVPWEAVFTTAKNEQAALRQAARIREKRKEARKKNR
ncbi:MAG: hypothetical protein ACYTGS_05345 [Planctomycetota bacterium]|jgi:hypothetical protein